MSSSENSSGSIHLYGVRQNNLKGFDLSIPLHQLTVVTGLSGSGKSSLAFETLYAEGQRRYVETFSPYARQFFERMDKPRVDRVQGIPPAIAIEQRNAVKTTRSTVGTMTEICDYMKALWPLVATLRCPGCKRPVLRDSPQQVWEQIRRSHEGGEILVTFDVPLAQGMTGEESLGWIRKQGYQRLLRGGDVVRIEDLIGSETINSSEGVLTVIQDRLRVTSAGRSRFIEAGEQAAKFGHGLFTIRNVSSPLESAERFSNKLHCANCDRSFREPTPALFSFNHPVGACPSCRGFGRTITIDYDLAVPDHTRTLAEGVVKPWLAGHGMESQKDMMRFCRKRGIPTNVPFNQLPRDAQAWVVQGDPGYGTDEAHSWPNAWYGVKGYFKWLESKSYKMHYRVFLARYRAYIPCPSCNGARFQPETLNYFLEVKGGETSGLTLTDFYQLTVRKALGIVEELARTGRIAGAGDSRAGRVVWSEVASRLRYLDAAGLGYLTLDRPTKTLSGGETERVNLTACLGARLVNTLFVLDEPSVGLHPRDTERLVNILLRLRDEGNTVVVVEHEPAVMRAADSVVDLGPGRGEAGGQLVFQGDYPTLLKSKTSLTAAYLSGRARVGESRARRVDDSTASLSLRVESLHNLRNLELRIPLGRLVCVTGVSGSGKTTLIKEALLPLLQRKFHSNAAGVEATEDSAAETEDGDGSESLFSSGVRGELEGWQSLGGVVLVDQSPLSRTPRSNPAGYIGAWDEIRDLFARSNEARELGLQPGAFSFNSPQGQCERCRGAGFEKIEMQFLSDLFIRCPSCEGRRYREHVLQAQLKPAGESKSWSIAAVLESTVDDALVFLGGFPESKPARRAMDRLQWLQRVGLGYLRLGQPLNTLSGGESQRLKLVGHLADSLAMEQSLGVGQGGKIFLLDEPTTGLHFDDVRLLLIVLQQLVDAGHSLVVIEHNMELVRASDWILDLGPDAGEEGGRLVVAGTPDDVMACESSHTGNALRSGGSFPARLRQVGGEAGAANEESSVELAARENIVLRGAREHNLKNLDVTLPRGKFVVVTGISGSGKSTLAFDLIFNEGQRRFLDCMSAYARQYVEQMPRPDVDRIAGIPPTVSIEQQTARGGGKSTVATVTEVHHFLRLLFARLGVIHCPKCGCAAGGQTRDEILVKLRDEAAAHGSLRLLATLVRHRKGFHSEIAEWAVRQGFEELRVDGGLVKAREGIRLDRFREHTIEVVTGKFETGRKDGDAERRKLVESTLELGKGTLLALRRDGHVTVYSTERACPQCGDSFDALDPKHFSYHSPQGWCPKCRGFGELFYLPDAERGARADAIEESWWSWQEGKREVCPECRGARLNKVSRAVRLDLDPGANPGEIQAPTLDDLAVMSVEGASNWFTKIRFRGRAGEITRDILPEVRERLRFMTVVGLGYLQLGRSVPTLSGGEAQRIRLAAQLGSNLSGVLYVLDEPTIGLHPRDNEQLLSALKQLQARGNSLLVVEHDEETMRRADHIIDLGPGAGTLGGQIVAQGRLADLERMENSITGQCLRERRNFPAQGGRRPVFIGERMDPANRRGTALRESATPYRTGKAIASGPDLPGSTHWLTLHAASLHNLQKVTLQIPLGRLTVVTGVSGSGKSTLIKDCLLPSLGTVVDKKSRAKPEFEISGADQINAVYEVDQSPIGRTPRSTPATYVGFFDDIRALFAKSPEARMRGYGPGRFSFNSAAGRCPVCEGAGNIKLEMNFLPPAYVRCESCDGLRFNRETLDVTWQGRNIADVLNMSVAEAAQFFAAHGKIRRPLEALVETGLTYLKLGQTSPTLSGGEAQRVKLVTHLLTGLKESGEPVRHGKRNLFVLEEPTIGLHMSDVKRLVEVMQRLVNAGHTVVVIEHNLDLIAEADWVVDLGPEGGAGGGRIVVEGTPEDVARCKTSHTGRHLTHFFTDHKARHRKAGRTEAAG